MVVRLGDGCGRRRAEAVRGNVTYWPLVCLLALSALLASCDAGSGPAGVLSCPGPEPAGCQCVAGKLECASTDGAEQVGPAAAGVGAGGVMATPSGGPSAPAVTPVGTDVAAMEGMAAEERAPAPGASPEGPEGMSEPNVDPHPGAAPGGNPVDGGTARGVAADDDPVGNAMGPDDPGQEPAPGDGQTSDLDGVGFVGAHGALRTQDNRVVDQHGEPLQLRGMSFFWSQWTDFYSPQNVDVMVDDWGCGLVRAALGVENDGGYLQDPGANVAKVRAIVDRAIERGVYVIIDWHDHHAQDHEVQATAFFREMVRDYGDQPHVIFEIYNEPMNVAWPVVKAYAERVIREIRAGGSDNLVIVGTPTWSQDVDIAAADRITTDDNVAYALHFYANTHQQSLRDKAKTALDRGIALFATEWGTCSADGNGSINEGETRTWLGFLERHSIGWANWALNDKAEACSAIAPGGGSVGPWRAGQLTASGRLVKGAIP